MSACQLKEILTKIKPQSDKKASKEIEEKEEEDQIKNILHKEAEQQDRRQERKKRLLALNEHRQKNGGLYGKQAHERAPGDATGSGNESPAKDAKKDKPQNSIRIGQNPLFEGHISDDYRAFQEQSVQRHKEDMQQLSEKIKTMQPSKTVTRSDRG